MGDCRHDQVHQTLDPYEVRVRTKCQTQLILLENLQLTDAQRARIESTPFKWATKLCEEIVVSGILLEELTRRWAANSRGFKVQSKIVPFSRRHVCFSTGLPIVGEEVLFDDAGISRTLPLLKGKGISKSNICEQLNLYRHNEDVEDYCRLYILLAFAEFYFPNTKGTLRPGFLMYLDDLDSLQEYNWGDAVYNSLVSSLGRASQVLNKRKNTAAIYINGCAALLQLWALEHVSLWKSRNSQTLISFPRILNWENIGMESKALQNAFKHNMVVECLAVTKDDIEQHEVLKDALNADSDGFRNWPNHVCTQSEHIRQENMIKILSQLVSELEVGATSKTPQHHNSSSHANVKDDISNHPTADRVDMEDHAGPQGDVVDDACDHETMNVEEPPKSTPMVLCPPNDVDYGEPITVILPPRSKEDQLQTLYDFCMKDVDQETAREDYLVTMLGQYLNRSDIRSMRRQCWVSNMVFLLAAKCFMADQVGRCGYVSRYMFSPLLVEKAISELRSVRKSKPPQWDGRTWMDIAGDVDILRSLQGCDLIFVPALYQSHWYCYVLDKNKKLLHVLDSIGSHRHRRGDQKELDELMRTHFEELMRLLDENLPTIGPILRMTSHDMPVQLNGNDCGVYVLSYMEQWDGVQMWGKYTMPNYTEEDINNIRRRFVFQWVLHNLNGMRDTVLARAGLPGDMTLIT